MRIKIHNEIAGEIKESPQFPINLDKYSFDITLSPDPKSIYHRLYASNQHQNSEEL